MTNEVKPISVAGLAFEARAAAEKESSAWELRKFADDGACMVIDIKRNIYDFDLKPANDIVPETSKVVQRHFDNENLARQYILMRSWIAATEKILSAAGVPFGVEDHS